VIKKEDEALRELGEECDAALQRTADREHKRYHNIFLIIGIMNYFLGNYQDLPKRDILV
jgi:hypothetical protein